MYSSRSKEIIIFEFYVTILLSFQVKEELGLPFDVIYDLIKDSSPIKKDVLYQYDGLTRIVEHYYFIITLPSEDYNFQPNHDEVDVSYLRT
jgi:hypothetical protein